MERVKYFVSIKEFTFVVILFISQLGFSQEHSLLWKIEGRELTKPSYLFGTVHALCKDDFELKPKIERELQMAEKLVLEVNLADPKEMMKAQQLMMSEKTISSQLNTQQKIELDSLLKITFGMTLQQMDKMSPALLVSMISMKALPCSMGDLRMFEMELLQRSSKNKLSVEGLETIEEQMEILTKVSSMPELIKQLHQQEEYKAIFAEIVKAYKAEDLKKLEELINDERFQNKETEGIILNNRNTNWIPKMEKLMADSSCFFAFGAAHLLGDKGVIQLLKGEGYTLTPVIE